MEVGLPGFDEGDVGADATLEDIGEAVEVLVLLAFGDEGADAGAGVEAGMPAPPARRRSARVLLGTEFDFPDFAGEELALRPPRRSRLRSWRSSS